jgi:hypothetical protein
MVLLRTDPSAKSSITQSSAILEGVVVSQAEDQVPCLAIGGLHELSPARYDVLFREVLCHRVGVRVGTLRSGEGEGCGDYLLG